MTTAQWTDAHTPSLSVVDSRGFAVRNVGYCRSPLNPAVEARITQNRFDAVGRLAACWDPRLREAASKPNLENTFDLQGRPLLIDSVDAGWQLSLLNETGETCSFWNGRGNQRHTQYDELQRPTIVSEHLMHESPKVCDRFIYGSAVGEFADHNQCGQLIRHYHPAGSRGLDEYGVTGLPLSEQTRFLRDLQEPDWLDESTHANLEDEVFETAHRYSPLGELHSQTDAKGNIRLFNYNRAGQLSDTRLKLADSGDVPSLLVSEIHYDALGNNVSERAGNSLLNTARFAADDGRLLQLQSSDANGQTLQDFNYEYDPVGNVTVIEDKAQLARHFNQERIDPLCRYTYDSLYQLIKAIGSEVSQLSYGPALPIWQTTPLDPNQLRNYTQIFNYDAAGNLQTRHHSGAETFEMFTSLHSNRSVAEESNLTGGFDANGNQLELSRGQQMTWDVRNQLSSVTMVSRVDGPDDTESYRYERPGQRLRKVRSTQSARRTLLSEVRYLPGLEVHRDMATGEERHVVSVDAGRCKVRALHWVTRSPRDTGSDQLRFSLSDHLNSRTLDLDERGALLSREVYYAYGGTAIWAGTSEIKAKYKTVRYSGKERDATGLVYYGYRYYAPWLQRWLSADPAGDVDGLNFFMFCGNGPVSKVDHQGLQWSESRFRSRYGPTTYLDEQEGSAGERIVETVQGGLDAAIAAIAVVESSLGSEGERGIDPLASYYVDNTFGPQADFSALVETLGKMKEVLTFYSLLPGNVLFVNRPYVKRATGEGRDAERLYAGVRIVPKDPMERMVITEDELNSEGTLDIAFIHAAAIGLGAHEVMPYTRGYPMIAPDATAYFGEDLISGEFDGVIVSRAIDRLRLPDIKYFFGSKGLSGLEGKLKEDPSIRASILMQDAGVLSFFVKTLSFALNGSPPPPYPRELRETKAKAYPSKGLS
jgi:insecticidal toxin complex protein TccC